MQMLVSDLDGTLLSSNGLISAGNRRVLKELGKEGIIRVIATGRSRFSFFRAVPHENLPVDYLVFSTGAGIMEMERGDVIFNKSLKSNDISRIGNLLMQKGFCFAIQDQVPDNHHFYYFEGSRIPEDWLRRRDAYKGYDTPLSCLEEIHTASQFLAITESDEEIIEELRDELKEYTVIRTTSPMDHKTLWIEIFPKEVSKGKAIEWLAWKHGITHQHVVAVGNDYNDLEMLEYSGRSFVTSNAPADMRMDFDTLCHFDEDVLPDLVNRIKSENPGGASPEMR